MSVHDDLFDLGRRHHGPALALLEDLEAGHYFAARAAA